MKKGHAVHQRRKLHKAPKHDALMHGSHKAANAHYGLPADPFGHAGQSYGPGVPQDSPPGPMPAGPGAVQGGGPTDAGMAENETHCD